MGADIPTPLYLNSMQLHRLVFRSVVIPAGVADTLSHSTTIPASQRFGGWERDIECDTVEVNGDR